MQKTSKPFILDPTKIDIFVQVMEGNYIWKGTLPFSMTTYGYQKKNRHLMEYPPRQLTAYEFHFSAASLQQAPKDWTKTSMVERICTPNPAPKTNHGEKHLHQRTP